LNLIEITGKYKSPTKKGTLIYREDGTEVEAIYIIGDFIVLNSFLLKNYPALHAKARGFSGDGVNKNDLVKSGYPFYAGSFMFKQKFNFFDEAKKRKYIEIDGLNAITCSIKLNNRTAGIVYSYPYRVEVTELLNNGENKIEIEITNSLRNLLGPHHLMKYEGNFVSKRSFNNKTEWANEYKFVKFGFKGVKLIEQE